MKIYNYRGVIFLIPIFTPILLIVIFAIFLTDFKNPFFIQKRLGVKKVEFYLIKLRSMQIDAEKHTGEIWSSHNDARITKIGGIIRKYRLDEIPQLYNIFKGEMSFVGPRPIRGTMAKKIAGYDKDYDIRFESKPGLTGLAQVFAPYGSTISEQIQKGVWDRYWLSDHSRSLYFKVLFWTVLKILIPNRLIALKENFEISFNQMIK